MRSVSQILNLFIDGEVTTKAEAAAILDEEVTGRVALLGTHREETRQIFMDNLGYASGYLTHEQADRFNDLFGTEHPVWGRTHPTPEEALRLGMEYAERRKPKEND